MLKQLKTLFQHPYNKKHPVFALYRFIYWKFIRLFKVQKHAFNFWNDKKLYLYHNSFQCMWLMYNYKVDWEEFNLIKDYVTENKHVVDVGTNMGYYSVWMSTCVSGTGKVYSFEPDDVNFKKLNDNIKLNNLNNIVANKIALSNTNGDLFFTIGLDRENRIATKEDKQTVKIASKKLDTYTQENGIEKYAYVKVDVEGFEYNFLQGAANLLQKNAIDIIQLEINTQIKNAEVDVNGLIDYLKNFGYYLCKYDVEKKQLIKIDYYQERENYFAACNIENINKTILQKKR